MAATLTISLAHLPEEGQSLAGKLDKEALTTSPEDLAQPYSELHYDIHVQRFDSELLVQGFLETTLEMTCVQTCQKFKQTFTVEHFASSMEITAGLVDLTDTLREELFIALPINPNCAEADEKMDCTANSHHLTVDKPTNTGVNESPAAATRDNWTNNWDALDGFDNFSDTKD